MKKRITVLTLSALLFALCYSASAQQPKKVFRIGYLSQFEPSREAPRSEAIRVALRELGYVEGQNIAIEYRYAEGKPDRFSDLAAELVRLKVDIIVAAGGSVIVQATKNATKTIPIIMLGGGLDPIKAGLVEKPCPSRRQRHRPHSPFRRTGREAAGTAQRSGSQTCPCRGSLRSEQSAH